MRFQQYLTESLYKNWIFPSLSVMKSDFEEYKKKEEKKWKRRAQQIGMKFPMFKDFEDFQNKLKTSPVVNHNERFDRDINNRSNCNSIKCLKELVSTYVRPRDVDKIYNGFQRNDKIPYPIVVQGSRGKWILAGNTRLDVAFILGIPAKSILINLEEQ